MSEKFEPRTGTWEDCQIGAEYTHEMSSNIAQFRVKKVGMDQNWCVTLPNGYGKYTKKSTWDNNGVRLIKPAETLEF